MSIDSALQAWSVNVADLLAQSECAACEARAEAEALVRRMANHVAALEVMLSAVDAEGRVRLQRRLTRAREALDDARRAGARVAQVEASARRLTRDHLSTSSQHVENARAQLAAMALALGDYRSAGAAVRGGGGGILGTATVRKPDAAIAAAGLIDLDVNSADLEENPVLDDDRTQGTFGKGGLSRSDYRWAVQAWHDIVGPGIAAGKTRQDFADRDARSAAQPLRRTADVYDVFLGSDRIRVDKRSDGSLEVVNGRHRLLIARELGINTLPGQVSG